MRTPVTWHGWLLTHGWNCQSTWLCHLWDLGSMDRVGWVATCWLCTQDPTKGPKILSEWYPPLESPKGNGVDGHTPSQCTLHHFSGLTHCPWCRKEGQNQGTIISHLRTVHYKLGLACARNVSAACPSHQRPSSAMARRTANLQQREVPMSHPHWYNH